MKIKEKALKIFKNKKNWFIVLIILVIISSLYWFYFRPLNIKANCKEKSLNKTKEIHGLNINEMISVENFLYKNCLIENKINSK